MATTQQEERLQRSATAIAKWDLEKLIHPERSQPPFNFEKERDLFETILRFYGDVATTRFQCFPQAIIERMANAAESVIKVFGRVQDFNFGMGDPTQVVNQIAGKVSDTWREAYENSSQHLAFARTFSGTIDAELNAFQKTVNNLQSKFETDAKEYANQFITKAQDADQQFKAGATALEKVMAAAREAAKTDAVVAQATAFEEEARSAWIASWVWLAATVVLIISGIIVVYTLFLKDVQQPQAAHVTQPATNNVAALPNAGVEGKVITATLLQQTIARLLIVTLLYAAVVWCARNYFASRHNYTVNRHRRNAMKTFQAFVAGTEDKGTQDFILRQAAPCAFSPQQTGYLKDESLPTPAPALQIVDAARPASS